MDIFDIFLFLIIAGVGFKLGHLHSESKIKN